MDKESARNIALYNAVKRDNGRCQICGKQVFKHLRLKYNKRADQLVAEALTLSGWFKGRVAPVWAHHVKHQEIEDESCFITLCQTHHAREHGDKQYTEDFSIQQIPQEYLIEESA